MTFLKVLLLTTSLIGSVAFSGGMEGGGGIGVECNGHVQTLDIYEAQEVYHLPYTTRYATVDKNILSYGTALATYWSESGDELSDPNLPSDFLKYLHKNIINKFKEIPTGTHLPISQDATLPTLPPNCSFVQIAFYSDTENVIYLDNQLWNQLDSFNKAALVLHESYYHAARELKAKTSNDTRRLIGLAMSSELPEPILKPFWGDKKYLSCSVGDSNLKNDEYYQLMGRNETRHGKTGVMLYAVIFKSRLAAFRTTAFLEGADINNFGTRALSHWLTKASEIVLGDNWNFELDVTGPYFKTGIRTWQNGQKVPTYSEGYCYLTQSSTGKAAN